MIIPDISLNSSNIFKDGFELKELGFIVCEEADFVIDEEREYKPAMTDFTSDYDGDADKPINLCKTNQIKVENQVCVFVKM